MKPASVMLRVVAIDRDDNLGFLHVVCQDHARELMGSGVARFRFAASPAAGTERPCLYCTRPDRPLYLGAG